MRVAVVGAGIMGASAVYHLAQQGIEVHLFDLAPRPAEGVTHNAFGWINTINGDPTLDEAYKLRVGAVEEYRSTLAELPELMPHLRRGSLVWKDGPAFTASFAATHQADRHLELVTRDAILAKEPRLKKPPDLAIYSPQDIAIDPVELARSLIARAKPSRVVLHYGTCVRRLEVTGQSVTAIETDSGRLPFDLVVLASGTHTASLLAGVGVSLDVDVSPVVLFRYRTDVRLIRNILSFPDLEIRQAPDGTVLVVEDFHPGCEDADFRTLRLRITDALEDAFVMPEAFEFSGAAVGHRPTFSNGLPRRGFVPNLRGLYLLVGHPGIILAPLLGRLAAEEITSYHP